MDKTKHEKINRFLNDTLMSDAVYDILLKVFLKPRDGDVQILAAQMIAVNMLQEGWKELAKLKNSAPQEKKDLKQVGL